MCPRPTVWLVFLETTSVLQPNLQSDSTMNVFLAKMPQRFAVPPIMRWSLCPHAEIAVGIWNNLVNCSDQLGAEVTLWVTSLGLGRLHRLTSLLLEPCAHHVKNPGLACCAGRVHSPLTPTPRLTASHPRGSSCPSGCQLAAEVWEPQRDQPNWPRRKELTNRPTEGRTKCERLF